ncbi:MAG: gluconokinase [Actinomycetota bacterium]|jgi:gluconokinase|nr:gluconokinase [Actinomycetota bacterium]
MPLVPTSPPRALVVMGVSGSGKSTVGSELAQTLGRPFVDADDLHPASNKQKMAAGIPLTDDDRLPWLNAVGAALAEETSPVVACSALKRVYRDILRRAEPAIAFVELDGSRELLEERMRARRGHFMPTSLLDSQLATLEPLQGDEVGVRIDISADPSTLVDRVLGSLDLAR